MSPRRKVFDDEEEEGDRSRGKKVPPAPEADTPVVGAGLGAGPDDSDRDAGTAALKGPIDGLPLAGSRSKGLSPAELKDLAAFVRSAGKGATARQVRLVTVVALLDAGIPYTKAKELVLIVGL